MCLCVCLSLSQHLPLSSFTNTRPSSLSQFPLNSPHGSEQIRREKLAAIPVMGLGMELDFPNMRPNVLPVSKSLPLSPRTPPPPVASIPDSPKRMLEIGFIRSVFFYFSPLIPPASDARAFAAGLSSAPRGRKS